MRLLFVLFALSLPQVAVAQTMSDRFDTASACVAAMKSGKFREYVPSFLTNHRKPVAGEEVRRLEADACVLLDIVGPTDMWVPQLQGTEYLFRSTEIVARFDCGNGAKGIVYIDPTPTPVPATIEMAPVVIKMPKPFVYTPRVFKPSQPAPKKPTETAKVESGPNWKRRILGGVLVGLLAGWGIDSMISTSTPKDPTKTGGSGQRPK